MNWIFVVAVITLLYVACYLWLKRVKKIPPTPCPGYEHDLTSFTLGLEPREEYNKHLDDCERCQACINHVLTEQMKELSDLAEKVEAAERKKRDLTEDRPWMG